MKLNPDCIRDVLIWLEDNLKVEDNLSFNAIYLNNISNGLDNYSEDEIYYTIYNLFQAKYIEGEFSLLPDGTPKLCKISNITWDGHQFLNTVRPKGIWDATKSSANKLGIMSISALGTLAMEITKTVVTNQDIINNIISTFKL